jgi:hypothetical protein
VWGDFPLRVPLEVGKTSLNPPEFSLQKFKNSQFSISNFKTFAMSLLRLGFGVKSNGKGVK